MAIRGLMSSFFASVALLLAGTAAAGISASPTPNGGSYTVSWNYISGASGYRLRESTDGGSTWSASYYSTSESKSFSGKPIGTYTYEVKKCTERNLRGEIVETCFTDSGFGTTTVVVANNGISNPPTEGVAVAVGNTPYSIDVANDGDAVINVPIQLIPGVAEFAPSLAIEYVSGRGIDRLEQSLPEDTIGYGWRVVGLSQIRRCVVNQHSSNSINLTNTDSLCLDGMPLQLASGSHFAVGAIYRTLIESYVTIEAKGSSEDLWFEAKLPDGTVRQYGISKSVNLNGGVDYQWSLDKEISADGNTINYTYYFDPSKGANYIVGISYTGAEVEFGYMPRTDTTSVAIGPATQTRSVYLHTIRVKYNGKNIREYRLLNEVVNSRRRLNKIQHCGYNEAGTSSSCLAPLDFDWLTPTSTMAGVAILVDGVVDSLNAVHQIEYGTITGSSHAFTFTERPFGNGTLPPNTNQLSGNGALRHVATRLRRDNGLGGFHDTTYAYQDQGLESTRHWGFLGFYAQRVRDEESGVVTYTQFRADYPYFGKVARLRQYDSIYPSHTETLTRSEKDYAQQSIIHSAGTTVLPYIKDRVDFIYEGGVQLGASKSTNTLSFSSGFVNQLVSTSQIGTSVSSGSPGSTWGDIPSYTISGLQNTTETAIAFANRSTLGKWLIGFPNSVTNKSWPGAPIGASIVRDATLSPQSHSMRPETITQFPNDPYLTLVTSRGYDSAGRSTSLTINGDGVTSRVTTVSSFEDNRYPGRFVNAKNQASIVNDYDSRFGTAKRVTNPNGTDIMWVRDEFGRLKSTTNADGVVTTMTFTDCPTGCGISVYGVFPSYYQQVDSPVAPMRRTYYDSLDRVIREETEPFAGSSSYKIDTKYDPQGRVEKRSLPYSTGAREDVSYTYDSRDRTTNVSRPDGSGTATVYSVSGSTVVVTVTDNVKNADGSSDGTQVARNEYNILGQMTKVTDGYGTSINPSTSYTYDANGNMLTAVVSGGAEITTTTSFEYDAAGNQTKIFGQNAGTITTTYTGLGEVKTQTDNKGQLFTHSYDVLGRLESITSPDGVNTWIWDTAPNGVGQLRSRNSPGFSESYTYDSVGRLSSVLTGITPIGGSNSTFHYTQHTYDSFGRLSTTTYPGGFELTRAYNSRGYLAELRDGVTVIQSINDVDAFGNSIDESYGNGVNTVRVFDPKTGRPTDIDTNIGGTTYQNNEYAWRSNGTLQSRVANAAFGLSATREETYTYDVLNRIELAETYINGTNTRDLSFTYNQLGNVTNKTSTLPGDTDVTGYAYGAGSAGPHAVTSASINGAGITLTYDLNGAVTKYDIAGTSNDRYIAYNAYNQPTKIVVGSSLSDTTPVARDEFAYGPDGQRYARKTVWQEGPNTYAETVSYVGAVEIISDNSTASIQTVTKVRVSPNVMHVRVVGSTTETFFEYAHRDHLGSIEVVTDETGNRLDGLAFEPFGSRKSMDWAGNISSTELTALLTVDWNRSRKARGFTDHEHLDRTGLVHMNGRVYDPVLGRFLSPDPFVQYPAFSQSWNRYSYVNNRPTSATDPTGFTEEIEEIVVTGGDLPSGGFGGGGGMGFGGIGAGGPNGGESPAGLGNRGAMEEIVVVGTRTHQGPGSATIRIGIAGNRIFFGVFDAYGNAGILARSRNSSNAPLAGNLGSPQSGNDEDCDEDKKPSYTECVSNCIDEYYGDYMGWAWSASFLSIPSVALTISAGAAQDSLSGHANRNRYTGARNSALGRHGYATGARQARLLSFFSRFNIAATAANVGSTLFIVGSYGNCGIRCAR